jgi:hypothetical protein
MGLVVGEEGAEHPKFSLIHDAPSCLDAVVRQEICEKDYMTRKERIIGFKRDR